MVVDPERCPLRQDRPVLVGVLGHSVAFGGHHGAGTGMRAREAAWPAKLQEALRTALGSNIFVLNGAARASTADFAALCWDEIWGPSYSWRGLARPPRLDLAIVDYAPSAATQQAALLDRLGSLQVASTALVYCPPPSWQLLMQCGLPAAASASVPTWQRDSRGRDKLVHVPCRDWVGASSRSLSERGVNRSGWSMSERVVPPGIPLGARVDFDSLELPAGMRNRAVMLAAATNLSMAGVSANLSASLLLQAAAVATAYATLFQRHNWPSIDDMLHPTTKSGAAASLLLQQALRPAQRSRWWVDSLNAIAAGECLLSQADYIALLRERSVPFATSAELLGHVAHQQNLVDLVRGGEGGHLNALGNSVLAEGISEWLLRACKLQLPEEPARPRSDVCRLAPFGSIVREQEGFASIDPGSGRVRGFAAQSKGAFVVLRLRVHLAGFINVAYELGWRNVGFARVRCVAACSCVPTFLNLTHPSTDRKLTTIAISPPMWMELVGRSALSTDGEAGCSVRIDLLNHSNGRLFLSAITVSAGREVVSRRSRGVRTTQNLTLLMEAQNALSQVFR